MDNIFVRIYNQNRKLFWVIVATIIAIIILIHVLNNFIKEKNYNENNITITEETQSRKIDKNYSVISGNQMDIEKSEIIDEFLDYCNNGQIDNAYNLLSDDCKEVLYPDVKSFEDNYYNKIFNVKKMYSYQAMIKNENLYTYQINFIDDILQTGNKSKTSIIDYYTIVGNSSSEGNKLNINKFITKKMVNSSCQSEHIEVNVDYKIVYYDFELYSVNLKNNKYSKVILDDFESPKNILVEDENGNKYFWANYEYAEDELILTKGFEKNLLIKFNKEYKPSMEVNKMIFKKVILNNSEETSIEINIL